MDASLSDWINRLADRTAGRHSALKATTSNYGSWSSPSCSSSPQPRSAHWATGMRPVCQRKPKPRAAQPTVKDAGHRMTRVVSSTTAAHRTTGRCHGRRVELRSAVSGIDLLRRPCARQRLTKLRWRRPGVLSQAALGSNALPHRSGQHMRLRPVPCLDGPPCHHVTPPSGGLSRPQAIYQGR